MSDKSGTLRMMYLSDNAGICLHSTHAVVKIVMVEKKISLVYLFYISLQSSLKSNTEDQAKNSFGLSPLYPTLINNSQ